MKFHAQVWIHLMLVTRGLRGDQIALLSPEPPMDSEMVDRLLKLSHSRDPEKRAESNRLMFKHGRLAEEWRRWEPVIKSGDIRQLLPEEPREDWTELISRLEREAKEVTSDEWRVVSGE